MISVNTVYSSVQLLVNKQAGTGYLSPDEFNVYASLVNQEIVNTEFAVYQQTQKVTDILRDLITKKILMVDNEGKVLYPDDYYYFVALRTYNIDDYTAMVDSCNEDNKPYDYSKLRQIKVKLIDNDKVGDRMNSELFKPSYQYPIATMYDDYIWVQPVDLGVVVMDYLQKPVTPYWAFTIGVNGLPVYDAANSVDFGYSETATNNIIMRIARYFSIEVREGEITAITQQLANMGV